jgi:hypothetical protein
MKYKTSIVRMGGNPDGGEVAHENTWIKRGGIFLHSGWGNGYVVIPKDHPFHGLHYHVINHFVSVHGGLTFSEYCSKENMLQFHLDENDIGKWIVGFDTGHFGDDENTWNKGAVQAETDYLLAQIAINSNIDKEQLKAIIKTYHEN